MTRATFAIGPAPDAAELTPDEYRAIRYSIAQLCRGEAPDVAAWKADIETADWLGRRHPELLLQRLKEAA